MRPTSLRGLIIRNSLGVFFTASLMLVFFVLPSQAFAADQMPCSLQSPTASGYFFTNFDNVQYSDSGFLEYHFRDIPTYSDGRPFRLSWSYIDDQCNNAGTSENIYSIGLPAGVTDWSVRFTSMTHLDVWDDQHNVIVKSIDTVAVYPLYTGITFQGNIDNGGSFITSRTFKINQNGTAPTLQDTLTPPPGCQPIQASGYYFDSYEHAEYVDGLLRIHLRLKTPYNDSRAFKSTAFAPESDCSFSLPSLPFSFPSTTITPHIRYYSFRMMSPTHWQLWNDENDIPLSCVGCTGDISPSKSFVSWYGVIDGGASTIRTAPFSPVEHQIAECCSSVMFLPGIEGSRLYDGTEKLWEPLGDSDVQALYLNDSGNSQRPDVYTAEVIDSVPITGNKVYESFLNDLAQKKTGHVIADYVAVPYDWRLPISQILANGKEEAEGKIFYNQATSTPYIEQTLRHLAENSLTKKVTIIAHSNGGLLAKALLNQLGSDAGTLVDQVILVGVPQLGTPQAIGALLHGFDTGLPFDWLPLILTPERARDFSHDASMAYQLLPQPDYYNNTGETITTPLISFEPGAATQPFIDAYGSVIGNGDELHRFLSGAEGRHIPTYSDLEDPAVANSTLLSQAETLAGSVGSSWQPPTGVTVNEIAGIGEDTLAGITYKTIQKCTRAIVVGTGYPVCLEHQPALSYTPNEVVDGDGTVVVPSALAMSTDNEQVDRWWVDLKSFNSDEGIIRNIPGFGFLRTQHGSILEVPALRSFIFNNLIVRTSSTLPTYISNSAPAIVGANRLRFVLHSPLSLSATSARGEISETVSTLAGATYKRYGEVQVVTVPADAFPAVLLNGVSEGSFTLEVEEYAGDTFTASTTFTGIPSTPNTIVTMAFPDGTIEDATDLSVDYDGNGTVDTTLGPQDGATVSLGGPSLTDLLVTLRQEITGLNIQSKLEDKLLKKADAIETKIQKKKDKNVATLQNLEAKIAKKAIKGKINQADADAVLSLLGVLEMQSDIITFPPEALTTLKNSISDLSLPQGQKDALLKRIASLENKGALSRSLSNLSAVITKKGEQGKITDTDVQSLLDLLGLVENAL